MAEFDADKLMRAYAGLASLRKSLPDDAFYVTETYVKEYHGKLESLNSIGFDIEEFKIPVHWIAQRVAWSNGLTGEVGYYDERMVEKVLFMTKLEAVLTYVDLCLKNPPRQMGFQQPSA